MTPNPDTPTHESEVFTDLVYDDAALPIIRKAFPHVKAEDASDYIHEGRVSIELPAADKRAYLKHAIREGYASVSLAIQLATYPSGPGHDELRAVVDELKRERTTQEPTP